jgi:formate hydrogenlyase subunit 7
MSWIGRIARLGRIAEPASPPGSSRPGSASDTSRSDADDGPPTGISGSLQLRHVDAGSCNGCELEIGGAFSPVYDAERFGVRIVASPRHADGVLATGVVTRNMHRPLLNTLSSVPEPRVVIAVGDCACNGGAFAGGYGVVGSVADVIPVDIQVPGCPPTPQQIISALRTVTGR